MQTSPFQRSPSELSLLPVDLFKQFSRGADVHGDVERVDSRSSRRSYC